MTWTSWRDCRRARGEDVANKICRKTKFRPNFNYNNNYNNNGYGNNGYGNNGYGNNGYGNGGYGNGGYGNNGYGNGGYGNGYDQFQDPYGNPDRRVCCSDGYRATWSSWRECRRIGGQDVANKVCRR